MSRMLVGVLAQPAQQEEETPPSKLLANTITFQSITQDLKAKTMSLISTLKKIGANVSNVSVSYRNKETGEQIRGAKITNGTLDIFTDPTLRLNALATCCASKTIVVSQTDPANPNETVSVSVDPVDIAATIASESGLVSEFNRLIAIRDDGSSMEELANSTKSILDNARNQAAILRNAITKQAQLAAAKPASKKPEVVPVN